MELERIEQYNKKLQGMKQQAGQLQASVDFFSKQLNEACQQLTGILGYQVTLDNLEQVYQDYMAKVENTVTSGEEIMRRIEEKQSMDNGDSFPGMGAIQSAGVPGMAPGMGVGQPQGMGVLGMSTAPGMAPGMPPAPGVAPQPQYNVPGMPNQQMPIQVPQGTHVWGAAATQGAKVGDPVIGI